MLHPAFPVVEKDYRSKSLFSAFDRLDFKAILFGLGLDENSTKMDLLQQTRRCLASDTY
jgi:hypothetical protein